MTAARPPLARRRPVAAAAFWTSVGLAGYAYAGFPAVVLARGAVRRRPPACAAVTPSVAVIIAAHNERDVIAAKLHNVLGQDYPADRLHVIVASDGSDDDTVTVARSIRDPRVAVIDLPRLGKNAALNAAVEGVTAEILVFSDANSVFAPDAVAQLVRPFADAAVGGVAGDQRYLDTTADRGTGLAEQRYWSFDRMLKVAESRAGSVVSATGAIYAIRRQLFEPIPQGVPDDFFVSTAAVAAGRRLVFAPQAVANEVVAGAVGVEFGRKVRVISQGLRGVAKRAALLDPRTHGFYALELASHKLLRRLAVVPLGIIAVTAPALWRQGRVYRTATLGQVLFYGLAAGGLVRPATLGSRPKLVRFPAYFCMVNAACARALWNLVTGQQISRWVPQRDVPAMAEAVAR